MRDGDPESEEDLKAVTLMEDVASLLVVAVMVRETVGFDENVGLGEFAVSVLLVSVCEREEFLVRVAFFVDEDDSVSVCDCEDDTVLSSEADHEVDVVLLIVFVSVIFSEKVSVTELDLKAIDGDAVSDCEKDRDTELEISAEDERVSVRSQDSLPKVLVLVGVAGGVSVGVSVALALTDPSWGVSDRDSENECASDSDSDADIETEAVRESLEVSNPLSDDETETEAVRDSDDESSSDFERDAVKPLRDRVAECVSSPDLDEDREVDALLDWLRLRDPISLTVMVLVEACESLALLCGEGDRLVIEAVRE